mgnify:CR=1 FL=1
MDEFETLSFVIGNYRTYVPPEGYIKFIPGFSLPSVCRFYIDDVGVELGEPFIILGDTWLRQYYVYHDAENEQIGVLGKTEYVFIKSQA